MSDKKSFRPLIISCILLLSVPFFFPGSAAAVSISASVRVIYTGESVNFTVTSTHSPSPIGPNCIMEVFFGDGSSRALPVCNSLSCTASTRHTYNRAGIYRATARARSGCPTINPPTSDSVTITVKNRVQQVTLPDGVVGLDYSYRLGDVTSSYTLVQGQTDPGLKIVRNHLQGIPQLVASYRFQIRKTEASGLVTLIWYNLKINRARLTITITPARAQYDAAHPTPIILTYNGRSSAPLNDILTSDKGIFRAGNTVIGTFPATLSAPLTRGTARFNESLTIPTAVIDRARQLGVSLIQFQRSFNSNFMDPANAKTEISLTFAPDEVTLPDGLTGVGYSYRLGDSGRRYQLTSGRMPLGLKLENNLIKGIPEDSGGYRFQLKENRTHSLTWYNLKINRVRLTITMSPARIQYDAVHPAPIVLTYNGRSSAPLNDTLTSDKGVFRAGATVIGTFTSALSVPLTRGTARFNESLTIPTAVIDRARQLGVSLIQFQRSFNSNFMDPANAKTEISLTFAPDEVTLPDGLTGVGYSYKLGDSGRRYQLTTGRIPPGLKLENNLIKGIPEDTGGYRFQLKENRTHSLTWYNLRISKSRLLVTTSPRQLTVSRNRPDTFKLTYKFKSSARLDDTLSSAFGIFSANGSEIGRINQPISTKMSAGQAQLNETLTIPLDILKTMERQGLNQLNYQRTFTARYLDATTTGITAVTVGTGFTFTKIKIYFDDKTSKKFVKRNVRDIGAQVELRYEGAGVLKGYWQADNRILSLVTMTLPFAKARTITLTLPATPPLPTFAQGSHRLRFVITEPPMEIVFPQIIYIVSGEDLSHLHPIQLLTPTDRKLLPSTAGISFSWKPKTEILVYKLEIFSDAANLETDPEKTAAIFSAYCKKPLYTVPELVLQNKFSSSGRYFWQVTGFDRNNQPVARSLRRGFTLEQQNNLNYVPKRLLLTFDSSNTPDIQTRLEQLTKQYHLRLKSRKKLTNLGLELVTLSTSEQTAVSQRKIAAGIPDITIQPDYYYATFGTVKETHNLEKICRKLHLPTIPGSGDGVRIAVIDTGVDLNLEDLAPNLIAHANYVENSAYQAEIHGTAVASIIAAQRNHSGCAGIAPQSKLIALRACYQINPGKASGQGSTSSIMQALNGALENRADIVNLSLGGPQADPLLAEALKRTAAAGVIIIAPAGNDRGQKKPAFPASAKSVVSVAGQDDNGEEMPNKQVADMADIRLPAQYVMVALPGNRISFMSGTSFASAEAAGLFAAWKVTPEQVAHCRRSGIFFDCLER